MRNLGLTETHYYIQNNKVLLNSTGNYTQYLVIIYMGKESKKEYMCVCVYIYIYESFCCIPEML